MGKFVTVGRVVHVSTAKPGRCLAAIVTEVHGEGDRVEATVFPVASVAMSATPIGGFAFEEGSDGRDADAAGEPMWHWPQGCRFGQ